MNDIQYSILSQPKKPTSSQGTRAISWASINNSLQGFQSLNFQAPQTPKTAFHEQNSMTNSMQKFFVLPKQEGPKNPQKDLSSTKNTSNSKPKAHIVSTYTQQPKVKKTMNGNKTVKANSQMKVCGSLPNLLSVPLKPENSTAETNSPKERIAAEQKKRVINQIATNFRFKPGHNSQSPGARKNMHTYRDQLQADPGSFNLISARMESPSKDKISSRKTIILSDSKQSSPRQISFRTTEKTTKLFFGKADSIKDFSQFGDDASPSAFKGSKVISNRSMATHKQDETQNFAKEALKIMADGEKKLLRPQTTNTQKLSTYKAAILDSKVTEDQRERFAMFLGDEFVNDLIYTKYYQVMDEDEKQNAIIALRQKMEQNKSIRDKFNETLTGGDQNFFEQFNSAGKISRQTTFNLQNQSKSRIEPSSPITMSPRVFNGFPNIPGPEGLTPKDSPLEESRSRIGLNALSGFGSPRQNKPKGDDYYTNLELTKMINLDEAKKKKKPKFKRLRTYEMEAMEKDRFSRIRKCLQEKLLKCVELKVTAQEMSKKLTIFTTKAFEKQGSYTFLKAAKYGDIQTITQYLQQDRFYVLEYDTLKQTALHWATKKGHLDICKILIENRADVDAIDMGGRTPIYYALRDENPELVRLLLASKASPWSIRGHNYMECCKDERSKRYLSKARQLSLLLAFHKIKDRASIWEREVNRFLAPIVSMSADNSLMVKRAENL